MYRRGSGEGGMLGGWVGVGGKKEEGRRDGGLGRSGKLRR